MEKSVEVATKRFITNSALSLCCAIPANFLRHFVRPRKEYLAQLWNTTPDQVVLFEYVPRFLLLMAVVYFSVKAWHCSKTLSALTREQREEDERRKREIEEETARANEWVHSPNLSPSHSNSST